MALRRPWTPPADENKRLEVEWAAEHLEGGDDVWRPFGSEWDPSIWVKWGTIALVLHRLRIERGSRILEIGCGSGWASALLAMWGYRVTGVDLTPARVERARSETAELGLEAEFMVADMDTLSLGRRFDFVLIFDALHHTNRRAEVVQNIGLHLEQGGWVLFGEPSWLHYISPHAWRTTKERGWVERGVPVSRLKAECVRAGMPTFRRFQEAGSPYERGAKGFAMAVLRTVAGGLWVAPQGHVWLAARRA